MVNAPFIVVRSGKAIDVKLELRVIVIDPAIDVILGKFSIDNAFWEIKMIPLVPIEDISMVVNSAFCEIVTPVVATRSGNLIEIRTLLELMTIPPHQE